MNLFCCGASSAKSRASARKHGSLTEIARYQQFSKTKTCSWESDYSNMFHLNWAQTEHALMSPTPSFGVNAFRKEGVNKTRQINKPGDFQGGTNEEMQFMPCCTTWCESATLSVTGTILGVETCRCLILIRLILNQISCKVPCSRSLAGKDGQLFCPCCIMTHILH